MNLKLEYSLVFCAIGLNLGRRYIDDQAQAIRQVGGYEHFMHPRDYPLS